jgi:thiol:disulfide interchange protein DsbD
MEAAGLITYGYSNEVVLLAPLTIASNATAGAVTLRAKGSWSECSDKGCVPGSASLSASLQIGADSHPSADAALLEQWQRKLPTSVASNYASAYWEKAAGEETVRPFVLEWPASQAPSSADFYAFMLSSNVLVRTSVEKLDAPAGRVRLRKEVEKVEGAWPETVSGLLIEHHEAAPKERAFRIALPLAQAPTASPASTSSSPTGQRAQLNGSEQKSFAGWLGFAFVGGLILNLMPCVLPVIALKIFGFVGQSQDSPARVKRLGLMYMVGVMVSFLSLALLVVALKGAGKQVSWGMQFSDARVLVVLTTLVMLLALNLFGVFEVTLSGDAMSAASNLASKEGYSGAFFNGVLATILATPCSAPFMFGAVGFAFARETSAFQLIMIFLAIGFGLALPYVALSFEPRWLKFLPKPGAWMERFKVLMGFPMLGTAIWLFTLTAVHYRDVLWLGFFLLIVALAAWIFGQFVQHGQTRRPLAMVISVLLLGVGYGYALETKQHWRQPAAATAGDGDEIIKEGPDGIEWRKWSPARIKEARAQGRPVLVDFTAIWCVTCNVNKNTSIEVDSVRKKIKELNVLPLLGDYTKFPPDIFEELQRFGRAAVPLVLVYSKDPAKPPVELPVLLTPGIVLNALEEAAK